MSIPKTDKNPKPQLAGVPGSARKWPITGAPFDEPLMSMDEQDVALRLVDSEESPKAMKLSRVEMLDGKPVACFIEDKPKCPLCNDTGMVRNDQSDQGWDDCICCEERTFELKFKPG